MWTHFISANSFLPPKAVSSLRTSQPLPTTRQCETVLLGHPFLSPKPGHAARCTQVSEPWEFFFLRGCSENSSHEGLQAICVLLCVLFQVPSTNHPRLFSKVRHPIWWAHKDTNSVIQRLTRWFNFLTYVKSSLTAFLSSTGLQLTCWGLLHKSVQSQ